MHYVLLCTDRFEFGGDTAYENIPDEELKSYVYDAALYSSWRDLTQAYVARLRDEAGVQVRDMPSGLPYDVDDLIAKSAE